MNKLVELRISLNLSPKEMAEKLGVSVSYYYKIEESTRNPSYNFLVKCREVLQIDVQEIFFDN